MNRDVRIGLALGSGSARGWAHIGVLRALEELGIQVDVVAGSSIGALVGAAYRTGSLDELEEWVTALDRMDIFRLLDARLRGGGFMRGDKLMRAIERRVGDHQIESLDKAFGAVATDLNSGREIWLRKGSILEAVRASIALPGLFSPVQRGERWLLDGGLVNPVPVSLCRAMGADVIIAVNLNGDIVGRNFDNRPQATGDKVSETQTEDGDDSEDRHHEAHLFKRLASTLRSGLSVRLDQLIASATRRGDDGGPGLFDVMAGSINVVQDRISRSRMAGDPPDVLIAPRLAHIRLMEFDRAEEAIRGGRKAVERVREELEVLRP